MKLKSILVLFIISQICFGQKKNIPPMLFTSKYGGSYAYGKNIEKGPIGFVSIYPETNKSILFYIDLNRGAPSYNMGSLYGRLKIENGIGIFYTKFDFMDFGCRLIFHFFKGYLVINGIEEEGCGFGGAVYADGKYKRTSNKVESYFQDQEGTKVYFKKTSPENYYKD